MGDRLVLGLGGTVDYEIRWDAEALGALARRHGIRRSELVATAPILDERSLVVTILAFFVAGTGGERFVASSAILEDFAVNFERETTLGGTGVRAGIALDRLGVATTQHLVSIDDTVRRLMPASVDWICSAAVDSLDPHVIVQYPAGAIVRLGDDELVAPGSNRLIFANDGPNREMALSDELPDMLAQARVFLVSGFNTMQDPELLDRRLDEISRAMRRLPDEALVYYEDAGFYRREFAARVRDRLLDRIDVYGMNEDELGEYVGREVDLLHPVDVVAALSEAHRLIPAPALVVHTRYWALAVGPAAADQRQALDSAVRVAATRYRLGDALTAAAVDQTALLPRHPGGEKVVAAVESALDAAGVAAVQMEVASPTTIGLGDTFVGGFLAVAGTASAPTD